MNRFSPDRILGIYSQTIALRGARSIGESQWPGTAGKNDLIVPTAVLMAICMFFFCAAVALATDPTPSYSNTEDHFDSTCTSAGTSFCWDFNTWEHSMGWTIPKPIKGGVIGGAIWLTLHQEDMRKEPVSWQRQVWGYDHEYDLSSPAGLSITAADYTKVKIRLLNRSPETDGLVVWTNAEDPGKDGGQAWFAMKPDCGEWQEVICHIDNQWSGTIDQIRIRPAQMWWRGDIWIDKISITGGEHRSDAKRPDLCSADIIPAIIVPGIPQKDFRDAFKVLDECLVVDVPLRGFNYPFLSPGGAYGENWWQLDGSLNIAGAKWVNRKLVEDMMRGFIEVQAQNPDGRIDLWGGAPIRGQAADVSSIPRYFEAAWDLARRTDDPLLQRQIYRSMKDYLGYWFSSVKRDKSTGLITAVFEESFSGPQVDPGIMAAVDLNVAVAIGCRNTSSLAAIMGHPAEADTYDSLFTELCQSINRYLWNDKQRVYLNYNVREKKHYPSLLCTTFDPLQLRIAPDDRIKALLRHLLDTEKFNWGIRPVTSIARTEPDYVEATGPYDGSAWFGDLWTMRNMPIIRGLEDVGRHDLATELIWSTIKVFNANYSEYVVPSTGAGEGVARYGWTASQYIQAIIEHLFGVDYDHLHKRLRVLPHIPKELLGQEIRLQNLQLPSSEHTTLDLSITQTEDLETIVEIHISGPLPPVDLEVYLPETGLQEVRAMVDQREYKTTIQRDVKGLNNIIGIKMPLAENTRLRFSR